MTAVNHPHEALVRARQQDRDREAARLALLAEARRVETLREQAALAAQQRPAPVRGWVQAATR